MSALAEKIASNLGPVLDRDPSEEEREAFLDLVRAGTNPAEAASSFEDQAGQRRTATGFRRLAKRDPVFGAAYQVALEEREALMAFRVEKLVEDRAYESDAPASLVLGLAAAWSPRFRREAQRGVEVPADLLTSPPSIVVDNLTDAEMAELEICVARVHELAALARERTARPAGEVEAA